MHKSDRTAAGCTVEDEPYKLLERDAEKSILAGPLRFPPGQLPFSASLKAPVPLTHDAVTVPVMFGPNISGRFEYHAWAAQRTGAFYEGTSGVLKTGGNTDRNSGDAMTRMDASRVTSAYGNSSTVQPSSLRLVHCIKS